MSNTRSTQLRPVVSLLALLVVASMVIVAPASAAWRTHRAPAFKRAVIALHETDLQAIAAQRLLTGAERRLHGADRRLNRAATLERIVRGTLESAPTAGVGGAATAYLDVAKRRIEQQRSLPSLTRDRAYARTLVAKASQRRAVVLGGLSLEMRQRVLRADHRR